LPGAKHDALTAATDFLQQFVIAQISEKLGGASCFFIMASCRSIRFIACGIVDTAGVIRLRRSSLRSCFGGVGGFGGRVDPGYRCAR
jgi:hypothetical protein